VAAMSPIIIFGGWFGNFLNKRFSQDLFRVIVLMIIFLIGMKLMFARH